LGLSESQTRRSQDLVYGSFWLADFFSRHNELALRADGLSSDSPRMRAFGVKLTAMTGDRILVFLENWDAPETSPYWVIVRKI
jgi:hypothetical protein